MPRFENGPIDVNETVVDLAIKTWRESKPIPELATKRFLTWPGRLDVLVCLLIKSSKPFGQSHGTDEHRKNGSIK